MHVQVFVTHHLAKNELLDLLIYCVNLILFFKRLFLTITIFLQCIFQCLHVSTFIDIVVLELCGVLPVAVPCHMVQWSARRFEAVNFFLAGDSWTSTINFQAANDSSITKRYVNHCKRGGIGVPEKVGGCSPPHPPHSSSLVRLAPSSPTLVAHIERGSSPFPTCCAQYVYYSQYTQKYSLPAEAHNISLKSACK